MLKDNVERLWIEDVLVAPSNPQAMSYIRVRFATIERIEMLA